MSLRRYDKRPSADMIRRRPFFQAIKAQAAYKSVPEIRLLLKEPPRISSEFLESQTFIEGDRFRVLGDDIQLELSISGVFGALNTGFRQGFSDPKPPVFPQNTDTEFGAIDEKIKALQIELIGYRTDSPDADRIGTEILTLRDEKERILSQSALQAQRTNEIRELALFFEGLSGPLITFDESYVRRLFSRIMIFDNKVVFAFKDGKKVTIKE